MLVKITKDYTYSMGRGCTRTIFAGSVYDEDEALVAKIIEAKSGKPFDNETAKSKKSSKQADPPVGAAS